MVQIYHWPMQLEPHSDSEFDIGEWRYWSRDVEFDTEAGASQTEREAVGKKRPARLTA